jgi:hypothetical protein
MAYTSIYNDIIFIEGDSKNAQRGTIVEYNSSNEDAFNSQLKSLRDVKQALSQRAKSEGYNSILDFTYGQEGHFKWFGDQTAFWGKGCLANIQMEEYHKLLIEKKN